MSDPITAPVGPPLAPYFPILPEESRTALESAVPERLTGASADAPADPPEHGDSDDGTNLKRAGALGAAAGAAALITQGTGIFKTWGLDRGRLAVSTALKGRDLVRAHPDLSRAARVRAYVTGSTDLKRPVQLIRDIFIGPTSQTIPLSGGRIKLPFGHTITNSWGKTLKFSAGIGNTLVAANTISGAINLASGLQQHGVRGIYDTKEGRMGSLQLLGSAWASSFGVRAALFHRNAGQSMAQAYFAADWLSNPRTKMLAFAGGAILGAFTTANFFGALGFMDED